MNVKERDETLNRIDKYDELSEELAQLRDFLVDIQTGNDIVIIQGVGVSVKGNLKGNFLPRLKETEAEMVTDSIIAIIEGKIKRLEKEIKDI